MVVFLCTCQYKKRKKAFNLFHYGAALNCAAMLTCHRALLLLAAASLAAVEAYSPAPARLLGVRRSVSAPPSPHRRAAVPLLSVPELQAQVQKTRNTARLGVFAGGVSIGGALYIGFSAGVLDPDLAVDVFWKLGVIGQAIFVYVTLSYEEGRLPTGVNKVEVRPSQIAGEGLFATDPIDEGAFLFNYEGERLNEDEYFRRYPDGKVG